MVLYLIARPDQVKQKTLSVLRGLAVQKSLSLIGRGMQLKKQGFLDE